MFSKYEYQNFVGRWINLKRYFIKLFNIAENNNNLIFQTVFGRNFINIELNILIKAASDTFMFIQ